MNLIRKRRSFLKIMAILLSILPNFYFFLNGCGGGGESNDSEQPPHAESEIPIIRGCSILKVTDPNDPISMIIAHRETNTQLAILNDKSSSGEPGQFRGAIYNVNGVYARVEIDSIGRPASMITNDGFELHFYDYTENNFDIEITHPDGSKTYQMNVMLSNNARDIIKLITNSQLKKPGLKSVKNSLMIAFTNQEKENILLAVNIMGFVFAVLTGGTTFPAFLALTSSVYSLAFASIAKLTDEPTDSLTRASVIIDAIGTIASCGNFISCSATLSAFMLNTFIGLGRCRPDCYYRECGSNGCGSGTCGECDPGSKCEDGECVCESNCQGKTCGDDGCFGSCGECGDNQICNNGQCVNCTPNCGGSDCGDDGCGGSCGTCSNVNVNFDEDVVSLGGDCYQCIIIIEIEGVRSGTILVTSSWGISVQGYIVNNEILSIELETIEHCPCLEGMVYVYLNDKLIKEEYNSCW